MGFQKCSGQGQVHELGVGCAPNGENMGYRREPPLNLGKHQPSDAPVTFPLLPFTSDLLFTVISSGTNTFTVTPSGLSMSSVAFLC